MIYPFRRTVFDCKQATRLSIKKEEGGITLFERAKLAYHLLYCDPCRRFVRQSAQINQMGRNLNDILSARPPFSLTGVARQRIQQQIDDLEHNV